MAKSKHSYDTSKYIPLPIALLLAVVALVILTIVGIKYSAFSGDLLSARAAKGLPPDPRVMQCAEEVKQCTDQEARDYDACTKAVNAELATCLKKIDPKKPKEDRDTAQADCEIKAGKDADQCISNACDPGKGVPRCQTMAACIKKIPK